MVATLTSWEKIADLAEGHLSADLRNALRPFAKQQVVHLQLPYGEKIISGGTFRWELLGEQANWKESYDTEIPVALVASKCVELYDVISHYVPVPYEEPILVRRSVPLFMTVAGQFFGLFENFASYGSRSSMRGTAGGTTLVALPAIGTERNVKNFLDGLGMKLDAEKLARIADDLQATNSKSKMTFGPFIRDVLAHKECEWRCDLIVLSPAFVAEIRAVPEAANAIKDMTLIQFRVSHHRADRTLEVFETVKSKPGSGFGPTTAEIQALHLIADGSRPGFVPVIGSEADEEVLPASAMHAIVYGCDDPHDETGAKPLDPDRHFPMFFRPSLPGEACFYLLGRPFIQGPDTRKAPAETRARGLVKLLGTSKRGTFWRADPKALTEWLIEFAKGSDRVVKLPPAKSHFIKLEIIGFTPDHDESGEGMDK